MFFDLLHLKQNFHLGQSDQDFQGDPWRTEIQKQLHRAKQLAVKSNGHCQGHRPCCKISIDEVHVMSLGAYLA